MKMKSEEEDEGEGNVYRMMIEEKRMIVSETV